MGILETPHLITHVETTAATTYDGAVMETIHVSLAEKGLLPEEHVVDSGYLDADILVQSVEWHAVTLVSPVLLDTSWRRVTHSSISSHVRRNEHLLVSSAH